MKSHVLAVALSPAHDFSKTPVERITLLAGLGVARDAHQGRTVKHRSRVARDPSQPNLRQVHLIHQELFAELAAKGFHVRAGDLGENVTTRGIDLLALGENTLLHIGSSAVLRITGLRNPCAQIDQFQKGLLAATMDRDGKGGLVRKAGVMAVVVAGGDISPGDPICVEAPSDGHRPLVCV